MTLSLSQIRCFDARNHADSYGQTSVTVKWTSGCCLFVIPSHHFVKTFLSTSSTSRREFSTCCAGRWWTGQPLSGGKLTHPFDCRPPLDLKRPLCCLCSLFLFLTEQILGCPFCFTLSSLLSPITVCPGGVSGWTERTQNTVTRQENRMESYNV